MSSAPSPPEETHIETREYRAADRESVRALVLAHRFPLFHYIRELDRAALGMWTWTNTLPLIEGRDVNAIVAVCEDRVCGVGVVRPSEWESRALGVRAASLASVFIDPAQPNTGRAAEAIVGSAIVAAKRIGISHLTARVDTEELALVRALERHGFEMMDVVVHFERSPEGEQDRRETECVCRLHESDDLAALREIARHAYKHDRLHADPTIDSRRADDAYAAWIENAANGLDDAVVVGVVAGEVVGFLTLRVVAGSNDSLGVKLGKIWLVGVDERSQNAGVFSAMARFAMRWFTDQGVARVEIGTQIRNRPALRAYSRAGFRIANSVFALRAHCL